MKYINRKAFFVFTFLIFAAGLSAQEIELPEVTTVISGETEKAGKDALPDFADVLRLPNGSGGLEPELPEVEAADNTDIAAVNKKPAEKSVYAEGLIGGGYPAFFAGQFSVARAVGISPFKFSFEHESALGYAAHLVTEGFSDRTTKLSIDKNYNKNNFEWGLSGFYKSSSDGLQGNLIYNKAEIGLLNRDLYNAGGNIAYTFENGFSMGTSAEANFYNRYAEISCPQIKTVGLFSLAPSLSLRWKGYGFDTGFTADYDLDTEFSENIQFPDSHRAKFMLDLQWKNDIIRLYGNAAAVIGHNIMENPVVVPFTIGVDSSFPVYFANRRVSISAEAGIDSYKEKAYRLEESFKFTNLNWNPKEVSEWYGRFNVTIPIKTSFSGSAAVEYRKTAYDNGRWFPLYNDAVTIYNYEVRDFKGLSTDFNLAYHQGIFNISGSWHSNWLDIPAGENNHAVKFDLNVQSEDALWGADVNCLLPIKSEMEAPLINAEAFVRLTTSVRAILSVNDIIKLYKGETRAYAGKYVTRGGSATLLLKFYF